MTYNASSTFVSDIIALSAEIVVGLGTSLPFSQGRELFHKLDTALSELEVSDYEPSGRHERALVKAADRAVRYFSLAGVSGDLDEIINHDTKSLADVRDTLNFAALSKALMAFDSGEAKSEINHLLPTIYVWKVILPEGTPLPAGDKEGAIYWRAQPFNKGRPVLDMAHYTTCPHYKGREEAVKGILRAVQGDFQIIEQEPPKPYLYILMRNDLASMNAGKAVAQGTHAANQMVGELWKQSAQQLFYHPGTIYAALEVWQKEANYFGTCIVLSVNEKQMRSSVDKAKSDDNPSHAGICHDPTYPLKDGETFHHIPVDTCAYIFDYPARAKRHLVGYPLMP